MTDIEIARNTRLYKISTIAKKLGIKENELELYGNYKAKISNKVYDRLKNIGFMYVTLDMGGYRTGSMNEVLVEKEHDGRH